MVDVENEIAAIRCAVYAREVRSAIADGLKKVSGVGDALSMCADILGIATTSSYTFVAGGISSNGTINATAKSRVRSENYIFARKSSTIAVKSGSTATFNVATYSSKETASLLSYRGMSSDTFTVEQDCYIRFGFVTSNTENPDDAAEEAIEMCIITDTLPDIRVELDALKSGLPITDFVGAEYDFDGGFVNPYVTNKVDTLYQLWDAIATDYPDFVTMETLGQDASGNYDIRCYTIRSYTDNPKSAVVPKDNLKILWIGGMHGSENQMLFASYVFFRDLLDNHNAKDALRMLWNNCTFKIIPALNPWGVDNNVRYNSNSVNLNRNFNASWVSDSTEYDNSGTAPESEAETQIAVDFIKANSDAFLVINAHNGDAVTTERGVGYTASNFRSDNLYSGLAGRKIDTVIKKKYPFICEEVPAWKQKCLWYNLQSSTAGTMDKWFNYVLGMHGFLIELCPSMDENFPSCTNEIVQRMNTICIGITLSTFVRQNRDIISDDTQIKTYSVAEK